MSNFYHFTVVFDPETNSFTVDDDLGFDPDYPIWDGDGWQRIRDEDEEKINSDAFVALRKLLGDVD